ncbi:protein kinase domain-containing protein [Polyangium aurulentum]|uniref:protein kinase domain-containing protein n=1 Tax=Polyangium aurulentum TaxID=2567896 RepID=UPI00146E4F6A|nr:protein kinase [Polyangium aurulentum]UQA58345.1 serine/threonine-protein kinase [Polyangium aurulentum]
MRIGLSPSSRPPPSESPPAPRADEAPTVAAPAASGAPAPGLLPSSIPAPPALPADLALRALLRQDNPTVLEIPGRRPSATSAPPGSVPTLAPGDRVGRYMLLETLGEGGMGVVYAAYDGRLDRKVALKVVRPGLAGDRESARARLLREAKAIARLSHPNVVTVYDVDFLEGDLLFMTMELVQGETLRRWLQKKRGWQDILDVFAAAGEGLFAAHEASLVHRDFKPDNVLLGDGGRVRVVDFGIAGLRGGMPLAPALADIEEPLSPEALRSADSLSNGRLTIPGAVLGTPRFMAPELLTAGEFDARSDQYAFCVALFEALYGQYPFGKGEPAEILERKKRGEIIPPAETRAVPARIYRALLRGLRPAPGERFPSMRPLLEELVRHRRGIRLRALGAAALIAGTLAAVAAAGTRAETPVCEPGEKRLAGVWDKPTREAVGGAILGSGASYARSTWDRLAPTLDDYAKQWSSGYHDACVATNVRKVQSADMLDRRMACYEVRRSQLSSLSRLLASASPEDVRRALDAARSLPSLGDCADLEGLTAALPPPGDTGVRTRVEALRADLAVARARYDAGRYTEAESAISAIAASANETDYLPLVAEVELAGAEVANALGKRERFAEHLRKAAWAAEASRHDRIAAEALSLSLQLDDSPWAIDRVDAAIRRSGREELRYFTLAAEAEVALRRGDRQGALAHYRQALESVEQKLGPDHRLVSSGLNNIAYMQETLGDFEGAAATLSRALSIAETNHGPDHPTTAFLRLNVATMMLQRGDYSGAQRLADEGLAQSEAALGPAHSTVSFARMIAALSRHERGDRAGARKILSALVEAEEARAGAQKVAPKSRILHLVYLARVLVEVGEAEVALEKLDRARPMLDEKDPAMAELASDFHATLARARLARGDLREGRAEAERAVFLEEKALVPDDPDQLFTVETLGLALCREAPTRDQGLARLQGALSLAERKLGEGHPDTGDLLTETSLCLSKAGRSVEARALAERAIGVHEGKSEDERRLARARFALARALPPSERVRAIELARRAERAFLADGRALAELAEVQAFLARADKR